MDLGLDGQRLLGPRAVLLDEVELAERRVHAEREREAAHGRDEVRRHPAAAAIAGDLAEQDGGPGAVGRAEPFVHQLRQPPKLEIPAAPLELPPPPPPPQPPQPDTP